MVTTSKPIRALTTEEVMSREVVTVPRQASLREAARLLRRADVGAAPVVDEEGRCVGMLSAADYLRWAKEGCPGSSAGPGAACPYQVKDRLLTGEEAVICTLAQGSCPLQAVRPTTGGRHTAICLDPSGIVNDWQSVVETVTGGGVSRYMTTDVVTAGPRTPLVEVARRMVEAHIHHLPVLDEKGRPVGIVSSIDVLAAVAREGLAAVDAYEELSL